MYKVPPSYYIKKALKAEDFNTWLNMTVAFWRTSAVHGYFLVEQYKQGYAKLFENMSQTARGER